jgi:tetratricopeptide (TPR) repeat protein
MDEELRAPPATHLANLKMRALFRIGQILANQKKQEEAIATWQADVKDYPNGPQWSQSQNAIINAEFQMGLDALTDKNAERAMQRFNTFLRAHPLDQRAPPPASSTCSEPFMRPRRSTLRKQKARKRRSPQATARPSRNGQNWSASIPKAPKVR